MRFIHKTAILTLASFLPIAAGLTTGCSASSSTDDQPAAQQPPTNNQQPSLAVVGGETSNRAFTKEEVDGIVGNTAEFKVDGVTTSDFSKVLAAQKVEMGTAVLVRNGNRLELQGSKSGAAIEIDGSKFTVVSDKGRWDCLLTGFDASTQNKMAGAMAMGILIALDEDLAAQAEEGRCEAVCIIAFSIIVGVGILAALTAFLVCETTGADRCSRIAAQNCENGAKKVKKICDPIASAKGFFKNGRIEFKGGCQIECK
jgi:hypothetical protein